jgi:hypothetical protein
MRFYGFHHKELFECHRAAAMCGGQACQSSRFEGTKVRDLFVLGDVHSLISRLKE